MGTKYCIFLPVYRWPECRKNIFPGGEKNCLHTIVGCANFDTSRVGWNNLKTNVWTIFNDKLHKKLEKIFFWNLSFLVKKFFLRNLKKKLDLKLFARLNLFRLDTDWEEHFILKQSTNETCKLRVVPIQVERRLIGLAKTKCFVWPQNNTMYIHSMKIREKKDSCSFRTKFTSVRR